MAAAFRSLVSEATSLQSLVKDLHGKLDSMKKTPIEVLSWKFPGRKAIEVNFDGLLEEMLEDASTSSSNCADRQRLYILELVMDRLLLVLQLLLVLTNDRRSSAIPLTFGTVMKNLSKKIVSKHDREKAIKHDREKAIKHDREKGIVKQQPVAMLPAANCDEQISGCCPRSNVDVSTQTIQTSFSICNDCDTKNYNLMNLVQTLETQCINVCGKSSLNEKNWKQAIETGGLREKDIRERFKQDLSAIVDAHNRLKSNCEIQKETIDEHLTYIRTLKGESNLLREQLASLDKQLQQQKDEAEAQKEVMTEMNTKYKKGLKEAKKSLESKTIKCELLLKEISHWKQIEFELKEKLSANVTKMEQMSVEKETLQTDEFQLRAINGNLEDRIKSLESQLHQKQRSCEEIQNNEELVTMELNKTQMLVESINKRYKRLSSEHIELIDRFKAVDDRCNELTREIVELNKKKEIYEVEICEMTNIIETCKAELITEKGNKSSAISENIELQSKIVTLNNQLKDLHDAQQLLMDFPFTNDIESIEDHDRCVSANNVRILLLEQQNSQIREAIHSQIPFKQRHSAPVMLDRPVRLWSPYNTADKGKRPDTPWPVRLTRRGLSTTQYLNQQQRVDSVEPLETFSCIGCDHVFLSRSQLDAHVCDIEKNLICN